MIRTVTSREIDMLADLRSPFREQVIELIDVVNLACTNERCHVLVTSGVRTKEQQLEKWRIGRELRQGRDPKQKTSWRKIGPVVTHAFPGDSPHNYGLAVDIPLIDDDTHRWIADEDERWARILAARARAHGLEAGHDFKRWSQSRNRWLPWPDSAHVQAAKWMSIA